MGLDMYAYAVDPKKCKKYSDLDCEYKKNYKPESIHYWRKHHDLHGWMENLYRSKGGQEEFNCKKLLLTKEDLNNLEKDVISRKLPTTEGFFFGDNPPDEESVNDDMIFISKARLAIDEGNLVYYDSWW